MCKYKEKWRINQEPLMKQHKCLIKCQPENSLDKVTLSPKANIEKSTHC